MKKWMIAAMVALLAMAATLTGLLVFNIVGGHSYWGMNWNGTRGNRNVQLVNTQTFTAQTVDQLVLKYISEDVEIVYTNQESIVLEEYMNVNDAKLYATISHTGTRLEIAAGARPHTIGPQYRGSVRLLLPDSFQGALEVASVSGDVYSKENLTLQSLQGNSTSGDISFTVQAQGEVKLKSVSGEITLQNSRCGGLALETVSGDIQGGNLTFLGKGEIKSISGDVEIALADWNGIWVDGQSVSGDVQCRKEGNFVHSRRPNSVTGSTDGKKDFSLTIRTTSGDIDLQ